MAADRRGFSTLELLIAGGMLTLVLGGVMVLFAAQGRLEWIGRGQYDVQTATQRVMDDIVEGYDRTWYGSAVRGLRYANALVVAPEGLAFRTTDHIVTYYRLGTRLYRLVEPAVAGPLSVKTAGGTPTLEGVTRFDTAATTVLITLPDGSSSQAMTASILLGVRAGAEQEIVLDTRIRLRNWRP
ncbi:MAG TPA: hypothetical protein VLK32_08245 [Bacillota bacterium]|nr:hypothetical protein [Bacillota bacterium]